MVILANVDCIVADDKPGTPILVKALEGSDTVTAIALGNDQLFVARNGFNQVSIYNSTSLQLQRQLTFTGLGAHIHGLATCTTHNYLYISDWANSCIHRVDLSTPNSNTLMTWKIDAQPRALSVNSARNILVAYYESQKVEEYTPSGILVRVISDSNHLWQAVELSTNVLAVSHFGPAHGVFAISLSTKLKHSFGNVAGSRAGQMDTPRGLSMAKNGYVIVADYVNNRIIILNPSLTDARQLPLPFETELNTPYSIVMDESRGRLYVGEWGGQKRLLVFENVTNVGALFDN